MPGRQIFARAATDVVVFPDVIGGCGKRECDQKTEDKDGAMTGGNPANETHVNVERGGRAEK